VVVRATIEGSSKGKIWVDDTEQPLSGFMASSEGWFLAGNPNNDKFNEGLKNLVHDMILNGEYYSAINTEFLNRLIFLIDSDSWKKKFPEIFGIRPPLPTHRIHYICSQVKLDWKNKFPGGYTFLNLDSTLDIDSLEFPEDVREWNEFNLDDQIMRGFGACLVHGNKVVVWINADCASGDECEIGIITTEDYRLRGLGALTAAAAVDRCLSLGYQTVGWQCSEHNSGSIKVAEKVGFAKERNYEHYTCVFDESVHYAIKGRRHFREEEHDDAIASFELAFSRGEPPVWSYLLVARSYATKNEVDSVLQNLERAKVLGWTNWDPVINSEEMKMILNENKVKEFVKHLD
jgi:RimJ/RimL family protein N-acetyltransferase